LPLRGPARGVVDFPTRHFGWLLMDISVDFSGFLPKQLISNLF
jgi:hypothetical protein